ncbi:proline dehydrogenase family protein [Nocardioides sp. B-3]|uniref:proline dehydrogenase family protein n=1 Tax=Nocardioides sp. B-3 TaxID=2895565 RepID=UPI002152907F|nr:proline dehydrogenase family protein [Nocardioides sp. B-3]UUZ60783.1 proline dehydrogenase family protein [Nocardioides sp. B-3]
MPPPASSTTVSASPPDFLGEDTLDLAQAEATVAAYKELLADLGRRGLAGKAEVSVKLSAVGRALPDNGEKIALENAREICRAARNAGTTVTLDMEDHTTTESTLGILRELRKDFPETGAVLQAMLHRTEADCRALAHEGSRVRLCKGAYHEPETVAFRDRLDVDKSYVRCLKVLLGGQGYPMIASHDPRMIQIASSLASRYGRRAGTYEFQMLYGIRPEEQKRPAAAGETVRVYIPYGRGVVRLPHAPDGRAPAEPHVLPPLPDLEEVGSHDHSHHRRRRDGRDVALRARPGGWTRRPAHGGGEASRARP